MTWRVGIDEAGFGPNLGPLVQASVSLRTADAGADLWAVLATVVRRADRPRDARLILDDSKKVHARAAGLAHLERATLALFTPLPATVGALLAALQAGPPTSEAWYDPTQVLPLEASNRGTIPPIAEQMRPLGVELGPARALVTPTPLFNAILDETDNKADVPLRGLLLLLRAGGAPDGTSTPVALRIDKQGGRTFYTNTLRTAFTGTDVVPLSEAMEHSGYRCRWLGRELAVTFAMHAESAYLEVAWASLIAKYLREVCMRQFNTYWTQQQPGLRPTAGYPVDAARWRADAQTTLTRLNVPPEQIWRRK
jgi:ribonuclease HII